jgi:two-component system, chemotaxis family, protein-glutamate methylesterase/glutaminase
VNSTPPIIKALVVDDSAYNRVTLSRMLESHPSIRVVGTAIDGEDAIKQVVRHSPDVVTLDLEMPVMDGFSFLRWIMANRPMPVIAVSSLSSDRSVFKALELGAVDFIAKPGGRVSPRLTDIQRDLVAKVLHVGEVRMDNLRRRVQEEAGHVPLLPAGPEPCAGGMELVAIGSSTGGPPALQHIFQNLTTLPVPFVIAQHMPPTFTRLFAERVNKLTEYEVKEAVDGDTLHPGGVYIAPGGMQMEVQREDDRLHVRVFAARPDDLYAPSVDRLFASASEACGERLVAVILTGMGEDGSKSLRDIKQRGGRTIAESAETAIVFGMPSAAEKTGCVDDVVPLNDIPAALHRLCIGRS